MKFIYKGSGLMMLAGWFVWSILSVITLGIAFPFALHSFVKYVIENVEIQK